MAAGKAKGSFVHVPVMLNEVLKFLDPAPGKIIIDGTLGGGGHAEAILKQLLPGGRLIGIDRDADALAASRERLSVFGQAFQGVRANLSAVSEVMEQFTIKEIDGLLFDLGVSSYQLDCKDRGFAYKEDVFLDMRMDQDLAQTAAGLLADLSASELARIFREYGEEKWAERIASFLASYRLKRGPVTRSKQLVDIIKDAVPAAARRRGGHPAKRVFQALRIAVNEELKHLERGLEQGIEALRPGGRIVVIAYHSLEDEIVKRHFRKCSQKCICPPGLPICRCGKEAVLKILTKKPLFPGKEEVVANPRSRSARLRSAEKLG